MFGKKNAQARVPVLLRLADVHLQHVAVGERNLPRLISGETDRGSVFGGRESDRNLIAGLDGSPGPVIPPQDAGTLAFDRPIHDRALVLFHIQKNLAMRIGPHEFRHRSRDGDPMLFVVSGISVVRPRWAANHKQTCDQYGTHRGTRCQLEFHATPSQIKPTGSPRRGKSQILVIPFTVNRDAPRTGESLFSYI